MSIKTKWIYFKMALFGDKELEEKGKMIPCKRCDKLFKSYTHYGEWTYVCDCYCDNCLKELKNV